MQQQQAVAIDVHVNVDEHQLITKLVHQSMTSVWLSFAGVCESGASGRNGQCAVSISGLDQHVTHACRLVWYVGDLAEGYVWIAIKPVCSLGGWQAACFLCI